jgi:hypothetical protein
MSEIRWSTFKELTPDFTSSDGKWLFRGQSDPAWQLETSYRRYCRSIGVAFDLRRFIHLLESFVGTASDYLERDLTDLSVSSKIALAQHHGIPTPFLDWTESPYIATFFALWHRVSSPCETPFTVWAMRVGPDGFRREHKCDDITKWESFTVIRPKLFESKRMARQLGWFTCLLADETIDGFTSRSHQETEMQRYDISGEAWLGVLRELNLMGIGAGNLFNSLDGVADDARMTHMIEAMLTSEGVGG